MGIFADENDHEYHLTLTVPNPDCAECEKLPRWPVRKVGYLKQNPITNQWYQWGWDFDKSVPGTWPWSVRDMIRMAEQERELLELPESLADAE